MAEPIIPTDPAEIERLCPGPGSLTWQWSDDVRLFGASGYALMLQVAHPTIGAGVSEFSDFRADPFGRLLRTLDYVNGISFGGPRIAPEIGRRVREMHKKIRGTDWRGEPYHALEPGAYAWVHATLFYAGFKARKLFVGSWPRERMDGAYQEWRGLGRLVGVRWRDLPETVEEFYEYCDEMIAGELGWTPATDEVLETMAARPEVPLPILRSRVGQTALFPAHRALSLATIGLLTPQLRERLGVSWSRAKQAELASIAAAARAAGRVSDRPFTGFSRRYLKYRQAAIARGDVASPRELPSRTAVAT